MNRLARAIRVPATRLSLIVNGKRGIDADMAARLGRWFGNDAQYWLNIQSRFDLDRQRLGGYLTELMEEL